MKNVHFGMMIACLAFSGQASTQSLFSGQVEATSTAFSSVLEQRSATNCFGSKFGGGSLSCESLASLQTQARGGSSDIIERTQVFGQGENPAEIGVFAASSAGTSPNEKPISLCSGALRGFGRLSCTTRAEQDGDSATSFSSFFAD